MTRIIWFFKSLYYRAKLTFWAIGNLPHVLHIADTKYVIPAWRWQVAIPCRTESTRVCEGQMFYEPVELPHFKDLIRDRKIFFDVGANIGYYSYLAAEAGVERIVAFEFTPAYATFAAAGFRQNRIPGVVVNSGVGNAGEYSEYADSLASARGTLISLDAYAQETGIYPDAIKMDIEGYELDALRNADAVLKRKPAIHISIHPTFLHAREQHPKDVLTLLAGYGYREVWSANDTYFMRAD